MNIIMKFSGYKLRPNDYVLSLNRQKKINAIA